MLERIWEWRWKYAEEKANNLRKDGHYVAVVGPPPVAEFQYDEELEIEQEKGDFLVVYSDEPLVIISQQMARVYGIRGVPGVE